MRGINIVVVHGQVGFAELHDESPSWLGLRFI